jgi:transcriptional regulator with XRE-family HTH domain
VLYNLYIIRYTKVVAENSNDKEHEVGAQRIEGIGERLFLYREAVGWSQSEVARRTGLSRTTVVNTENGVTYPSMPTLRRLSRAFGVSLMEFLSDDEPKPRPLTQGPALLDRLQGLPAEDRRLLLRGLWEDWTAEPGADARGIDLANDFLRETGATADDVRRALTNLDTLEAQQLLVQSEKHREEAARYWRRLMFEATAEGDLSPAQAARKAEEFGAA